MRKIILISLVFFSVFAKAQVTVNPETFPQVSGAISDKYLYTNTGGEGKIKVKTIFDSVPILDTTSLTYNDFYTLISGGNLQTGRTYILVDFQTIYDQMDFDASGALKSSLTTKTGAIEEIWVYALANDRIASTAYSKTYPNDKIQYDWTYNATLVNGSPAKGRISERIDEWNNRTDYDHREIKFLRYDDGSGNYTSYTDNGNASQEFLTFGNSYGAGGIIYDNWLGDFYSIGALGGQEYGNNVFNGSIIISNKTSALFANNTFSGNVNNNTFSGYVNNNTFDGYLTSNSFDGYLTSNSFGGELNSNSFDGYLNSNSFGEELNSNSFDGYLTSNSFGGALYSNSFGGDLSSNSFGGDVHNNIFSGYVHNNIFSGNVQYNTFSGYIDNNTFTFTSFLSYSDMTGVISSKTIDETTYPFLFGTDYEKRIFKASDNNVYARYFDGTNDINVLIP